MAKAYKKYILIDHGNNRHVFINSLGELSAWFAGQTPAVDINALPVDGNGLFTTLKLIRTDNGVIVPIKKVVNNASVCFQ
jgi:hypothetical protein